MIRTNCAWLLGLREALCLMLLAFAGMAPAQAACPGLPPPDKNLFLIPNDILTAYDFTANGITIVHDYGNARLVHLSDLHGIPPNIKSQIPELPNLHTISFRQYSWEFITPLTAGMTAPSDGYCLLALFGPLDAGIISTLKASGIFVLGNAPPFGLLAKADDISLGKALKLCTSEGYRIIREVFPIPFETRLSPILLRLANGEAIKLDDTSMIQARTGEIVIRVFPYKDGSQSNTFSLVSSFLAAAPSELTSGYENVFLAYPDQLSSVLKAVNSIEYIEPISKGAPSANIAMRQDILNIAPVWTNPPGYTGAGVTIFLNELGGVDYTIQDLTEQGNFIVKSTIGNMLGSDQQGTAPVIENSHGTHAAGLITGRGWNSFTSASDALCRPLPEEWTAITPPSSGSFCGENITSLGNVRGAAPGAWIVANNATDASYNPGYPDIPRAMKWGYTQDPFGARIASNSWHNDPDATEVDNCNPEGNINYGVYNSLAVDVDKATRDSVDDQWGNQEMLIVFSAGNNDYMGQKIQDADANQNVVVQAPGVSKNALTVGATENARCGFARNYNCTILSNPKLTGQK